MWLKYFNRRNPTSRKSSFFLLYVWLLSYLVICLVMSMTSTFLYSSLVKTTEEQVEQTHMSNLDKVVTQVDNDLSYANKVYSMLSKNDKVNKLIYDELPTVLEDKYSIELAKDISQLLSTMDFTDVYIYFQNRNIVISSQQRNSPEEFFSSFYGNTSVTYQTWQMNMKSANMGNYLSVQDEDGWHIDMMYQLPIFIENTYVHATMVLRISDTKLKNITGSDRASLAIIDSNDRLLMASSYDFPKIGTYYSYSDDIILQEEDYVTMCRTSSYNTWKYLYTTNNSKFYKKIEHTKHINIAFILLSLLLCCGLGIYFSIKNYHPLNELIKIYKRQAGLKEDAPHNYKIVKEALSDYVNSKRNLNSIEQNKHQPIVTAYLTGLLKGTNPKTTVNLPFPTELFSVVIFRPYNTEKLFGSDNNMDIKETENTTFFIIQNVMEELFNKSDYCKIIQIDDCIAGIYCYRDEHSSGIYKNGIHSAVTYGLSFIKTNFQFGFDVGISSVRNGMEKLSFAYNEARLALGSCSAADSGIVFYDEIYRESLAAEKSFFKSFTSRKDALIVNIENGDSEGAREILDTIFSQCVASLNIEKTKIILLHLESAVLSALNIAEDEFREEIDGDIMHSMSMDNISDIFDSLTKITQKVCDARKEAGATVSDNTEVSANAETYLPKIIDYIRTNYTDSNLNVTAVSEYFNMSSYYISKVFKNTTGESIIEYIAKLRMEKAKRLLESTDLSITDVYLQSGFASEKTFSRTFNKYEAITPGKYRRNHKM